MKRFTILMQLRARLQPRESQKAADGNEGCRRLRFSGFQIPALVTGRIGSEIGQNT
jgi:hypothetical protein